MLGLAAVGLTTVGSILYPEETARGIAYLQGQVEKGLGAYDAYRAGHQVTSGKTYLKTIIDNPLIKDISKSSVVKQVRDGTRKLEQQKQQSEIVPTKPSEVTKTFIGQMGLGVNDSDKIGSLLPLLAVSGPGRAKLAIGILLGQRLLEGKFKVGGGMESFGTLANDALGLAALGAVAKAL